MTAREEMLAKIRSRLGRELDGRAAVQNPDDLNRAVASLRPVVDADPVAHFNIKAEAVDATVEIVDNPSAVPKAIESYLRSMDVGPQITVGDEPQWQDLPWEAAGLDLLRQSPRQTGAVGLSRADFAVAETSTLVLASGPNNPATLNFLPDHHIVWLDRSRIVAYQEEVWASFREQGMPRALAFVTGPSRTGDIELKLQHGAHGPRHLHILIVTS